MMRKTICLLAALVCAVCLTGCSSVREEERKPAPTLPPAEAGFEAPDGDGILSEGGEYRVYLPGRNVPYLVFRNVDLEAANLNDTAEMLLRKLISWPGDAEIRQMISGRPLELYGAHPVEISGGVCTVSLSTAALQMTLSDYYKYCIAIATTLCELQEINSVNVLVADQSVGLDITGNLPMGTLAAHPGENLSVLWEQMESRRTPLGEDLSRTPLSAAATLYYPLLDGRGISCTTRTVNFDGQTPGQLAMGLIRSVSETRRNLNGGQNMPDLAALLLHEPVTSELEDGGRLITLSLREDAEERLKEGGADLACTVAALTCTLTTFIPGIAAVCVRIGETPITELRTQYVDPVTALGGLVEREAAETFLMSSVTVYLARDGVLCECEKPVSMRGRDSLRAQLVALLEGPDPREAEEGITATLPGNVREDDILGIAAEGGTLLVNLSEGFRSEIQDQGPEKEALTCYSMVNTLCRNTGMKRVRFFFEGEQVETVAGGIYWAGEFLYNIGLAEKGLG